MEATGIVVPFDPTEVWGKVRVPVVATVNGYEYRTTIAQMGGRFLMPFAKEHRDASGIGAGDAIEVRLVEDTSERTVEVPADFAAALKKAKLVEAFEKLSFTHRKEHVRAIEEAKKAETRARRIEKAIDMIAGR